MKKEQGTLPRCWGRTQRRGREDRLEVWRDLDGTKGTSQTRVVHQRLGSGVRAEPQHDTKGGAERRASSLSAAGPADRVDTVAVGPRRASSRRLSDDSPDRPALRAATRLQLRRQLPGIQPEAAVDSATRSQGPGDSV